MNFSWTGKFEKLTYHQRDDLPNLYNDWFAGSGACVQCHGLDENGIFNVDGEGNDVNVVDDWKATLMANSAKDPFWKAKVSHEILSNPSHQSILEDKCTQCHAPMGNYNNVLNEIAPYTLAELAADSVALDGVSCLACHQQTAEDLGTVFSGELHFDTLFKAFGPYESPLISPMASATGYIPEYAEHIFDPGLCAGCHSLITETVDLSGEFTGDEFVEQATYHEWLNSAYNIGESLESTCQDCHMPIIDSPVQIANGYNTEPRSPYALHELVGANVFMLNMMKDNIDTLGLSASAAEFEEVAAKTLTMLESAIELEVFMADRNSDTAYFEVQVQNNAGHKFPSGFPSRRAFIEFVVLDENEDTLFASGITNDQGFIVNYDSDYEQHYDQIDSEEQAQVYELIMADVNDQPTTILERAKYALKDNRLPPKGFNDTHFAYDTCAIFGQALNDPNFNFEGGQGTGSDKINYWIPMNGYSGGMEVHVRFNYQAVPRKWLEDMFTYNSDEIDLFQYLFDEADHAPLTVQEDLLFIDPNHLQEPENLQIEIWPTLSSDGQFIVNNLGAHTLEKAAIYNSAGQMIEDIELLNIPRQEIRLEGEKGVYLIVLYTRETQLLKRIVLTD